MVQLTQSLAEFEQVLEKWREVITLGGSIDPYHLIVASIRVSSVILEEYPKINRELEELREWKQKAVNFYPDLERME